MSVDELLAQLIFSASGKDVRIFYTTAGTPAVKVIEYVGITNAVGAATSVPVWFISKLEYDATACVIRVRSLSTQKILDDRATFFP